MPEVPLDRFTALDLPEVRHAFIRRIPGIEVSHDKAIALARLDAVHRTARAELGGAGFPFLTATQVHGTDIAVIDRKQATDECFEGRDALITNQKDTWLGIYVADCCAVYLVDQVRQLIALAHSGRKGSELGIVPRVIATMRERFGSDPKDLLMQLSPCIRPPHYETDFAVEIMRQAQDAGVTQVTDAGICTACDLAKYYSYRAEKGKTGRMLALLALRVSEVDPLAPAMR